MTTLGKIVGGGMPMAVYGGRNDIMKNVAPVGKVYQAGTLSGNPIATTAGIRTIELLMEDPGIYDRIEENAKKLAAAFRARAKRLGISLHVNQVGSLLSAFFTDQEVKDYAGALSSDTNTYAQYFNEMLEKNIYVAPSQFEAMFISGAHSDDDIAETIKVLES
jgi:glutamate-1-semialdehyde 2,1-aminomutase